MTSVLSETTAVSRPAPSPVASAAASRVAVLLAVVLAAAGCVGIRDVLVGVGWLSGVQWTPTVIDALDGVAPSTGLSAAGAVVGLIGIALMVLAVLPRRRTAFPLSAATAVYLRRADIPKLASAAALDVPGVLQARTNASRTKAVVRCRVTGQTEELRKAVADAVARELGELQTPPRVVVRIRTESTP